MSAAAVRHNRVLARSSWRERRLQQQQRLRRLGTPMTLGALLCVEDPGASRTPWMAPRVALALGGGRTVSSWVTGTSGIIRW